MRCRAWLAVALTLAISLAYAAEIGYMLRAAELKAKPFLDAETVTILPEKSEVEILIRQGAWMQIRTKENRHGWVRMLSVRLGDPDQVTRGGNLLSALSSNRQRPLMTATVTTGVRGFSEEDLAKATPNPAEVAKMKGYTASPAGARQLADKGKLKPRQIVYFDENGVSLKEKK
jgi:hypothetical protein